MMLALEPRAKLAIVNGGGLRADLPAGPLEYGALYNALPFDNRLTLVAMKGRALKAALLENQRAKSGVLSLAGAKLEVTCKERKLHVDLIWPSNERITDDEDVYIVTNDFLATGGDAFPVERIIDKGAPVREAIVEKISKAPSTFRVADWYEKSKPRLVAPMARPVRCP
jgi:2',3'-cyclic-nucleotide 2'-phosphodiesterase (5'-nucleotidase family)